MNRAALCIKMLLLLKARGMMTISEIAQELETNPRNVRAFRNELMTAGYSINEKRGRYGGYFLEENLLLPVFKLTDEEIKALKESYGIVKSHPEYESKYFRSALDKILSVDKDSTQAKRYYLNQPVLQISKKEKNMIDLCQDALNKKVSVSITYQALNQHKPNTFLVDPYEIIHYKNAYYVLGFSHRRKDYRMYRFSEQRMKDCLLTDFKFLRDPNFHIANFIGNQSLIKGDFIKVEIAVDHNYVRIFKEQFWGLDLQEVNSGKRTVFTFVTENVSIVYQQLFAYKNHAEILSPLTCRQEYFQSIKEILHMYD